MKDAREQAENAYETPEESLRRAGIVEVPVAKTKTPKAAPNGAEIDRHSGRRDAPRAGPALTGDDFPKPRFRTLNQFCAEYRPLAEVVDGVLVSGSLYTMTATTGTGKTALMVTTALAGITGRDFLGRRVKKGRYAFCTAENPDGVRMRFAVGAFHWNIDPAAVHRDLLISDNRVRPEEIHEFLAREAEHGPFTGIFIDTWQAFFDGRDANNPTEAVNFTKRFRPLASLPGSPAVVIAAHPNKNASPNELIPSGGGSTLNEVDGNLSLSMQPSGLIELGWQGKFRGYHFEPQLFRIEKLCSPDIVDVDGRQIAVPIMMPATSKDAEAREAGIANREIRLLRAIDERPGGTATELATEASLPRGSVKTPGKPTVSPETPSHRDGRDVSPSRCFPFLEGNPRRDDAPRRLARRALSGDRRMR